MKYAMKDFATAIETLLRGDKTLKAVTVLCSPLGNPEQRIRVTRKRKYNACDKSHELIVSYGSLNYAERELFNKNKKKKIKVMFWYYPKKKK